MQKLNLKDRILEIIKRNDGITVYEIFKKLNSEGIVNTYPPGQKNVLELWGEGKIRFEIEHQGRKVFKKWFVA